MFTKQLSMSWSRTTITRSGLVIASIALAALVCACAAPPKDGPAESLDATTTATGTNDTAAGTNDTSAAAEIDAVDAVDIPDAAAASPGKTVVVKDTTHFCLFLPRRGQTVAASETNARPFCTVAGLAPGGGTLPHGTVSTHQVKTAHFIQITGRLDVAKLGLRSNDSGGQYDNYTSHDTPHGSPVGATCQGYKFFVEQVEPDAHRYCIRCCDNVSKNLGDAHNACIENHSSAGCDSIMPGASFE